MQALSKTSFFNLNFEEVSELVEKQDLASDVAAKVYNQAYKKLSFDLPSSISLKAKSFLSDYFDFKLPTISTVKQSEDKTVKFLIQFEDLTSVETVLIPFNKKYSLCLSSQVGCAMKCDFCHTGTQGLNRNLSTHEIMGQFLLANLWLQENRPEESWISNVVFMGQGEPLHNFDAVKKACQILISQYGISMGRQKISVSTSGYLPGLKRWSQEMPGVNLALSLHSADESKRSKLIPINQKYPLENILKVIDEIPLAKKQFVTHEYLLLNNFNDSLEDAHKLGKLLQNREAYINLISFNPYPGAKYERSSAKKLYAFKEVLDTYKVPTLIRDSKGDDVLAACGQLKTQKARRLSRQALQ